MARKSKELVWMPTKTVVEIHSAFMAYYTWHTTHRVLVVQNKQVWFVDSCFVTKQRYRCYSPRFRVKQNIGPILADKLGGK
jgi:hypothetical protein